MVPFRAMITSSQNAHFKQLRELHKKRERDRTGLFVVEGEKEIAKCQTVIKLYYTERTPFVDACPAETVQLSKALFARIAYRERGVIAIAQQKLYALKELSSARSLLILEGVEKPGNVGAILRTAKAAGVDGIILCNSPVDLFHPNVIRSSLGCSLTQTVVSTTTAQTMTFLQQQGFSCVIATPGASISCFQHTYKEPFAIVVGSEAHGVSDAWNAMSVEKVQIPMNEGVDSLNVSVSAAIILYYAQFGAR